MKFLKLIVFIAISASTANGQASFQKAISFGDTTYLVDFDNGRLALTPDNGIMIMETRRQPNVKEEFLIQKFDSALNPVYTTRMRRPFISCFYCEIGIDALPLADGGVLFSSNVVDTAGCFALFRFDNQGLLMYHRQYNTSMGIYPFNLKYFAQDSILLGFRTGYWFGYLMTRENGDPLHIRAGDFTGIKSYGNTGMIRTADGHILNFTEAFWDTSPADKAQLGITMYDRDGNLQWNYRYQDTLHHYYIHDGIELANGNFLFCGYRRTTLLTGGYGLLICVSPNGQFLWSKTYNPLPLIFNKLTQIAPDTILVSGMRDYPYYGVNIMVDSTGTPLFGSGYNSGGQYSDDYHYSVSNSDGHLFSASGINTWGDPGIILSKSYPSDYAHCTHNTVMPIATPVTGFTLISDFVSHSITMTSVPPTRTYVYDNTLPSVTLHCTSTSINETGNGEALFITISPNPGNGTFNVKIPPGMNDVRYDVVNQTGQLILTGYFSESETTLHLDGHAPGIYLLRGYFKNGIMHKKLVMCDQTY